MTRKWLGILGLVAALVCGAVLRFVWVEDIEYKYDEAWTFERAQAGVWTWEGMNSSVGLKNPGMSLWVFIVLDKLFACQDPTDLARAVQCLNVAALVALVWFAYRVVPTGEREPWLWAAALGAVSAPTLIFQRKIWPPSVFPLLVLVFLTAWWHRGRLWGAFTWGLVGACLGQIHMSGFFFAAGFAAWALLFGRKQVAWVAWLGGSCLGTLPLLPWLYSLATQPHARPDSHFVWTDVFRFWYVWSTDPFGLDVQFSLGKHFQDFLTYPVIAGRPTHLVLAVHVGLIVAWAVLLVRGGYLLWKDRAPWRERWIGRSFQTAFTQNAALWGYGVLLTLTLEPMVRHYAVILFPLTFVWLARLVLAGTEASPAGRRAARAVLVALFLAQLFVSASFLAYIRVNHGAPDGDYGVTYGARTEPIHTLP
jgi:hypothetical protein